MTHNPALTRRGVLAAGGAAILGAAGGFALGSRSEGGEPTAGSAPSPGPSPAASPSAAPEAASASAVVAFHGPHQAGVDTAPTTLQAFVGLDLRDDDPASADAVLRLVSDDAARLTQGLPALGDTEPALAAHPHRLTVTVGLGRSLFMRTGLVDSIPAALVEIPPFTTDRFEDEWPQTDLVVQVGSDDAVTLAHTVRMLTKDLSTLTRVRWIQNGFRSAEPALPGSTATRNLMGQVDGTVNPASDEYDAAVWIPDGPAWLAGGTVLVLRRIRMLLDTWEVLDLAVQESVMGRRLDTGAPIGAVAETDPVPFDDVDEVGLPVIAQDAHVRVAHASSPAEMILRRPYSYDNGMRDGTNDVGLLFAAYTRDPSVSFIPMQERIAQSDAFNRWNTTIGSAAYLIPAGAPEGGYVGQGLFA